MGNAPSDPSSRPSPLRIHPIHGKSVKISKDRLEATRFEGYTDSIIFGSRQVEKEEQIEIVIKEMVSSWNGSIRFGFIYSSPEMVAAHKDGLPHYVCPDLTKRGGCFIDTQTNFVQYKKGDKIVIWVSESGEIKLKINGFPSRIAQMKVERKVYPLVDVYGNCTKVSLRSLRDDYSMPNQSNGPILYSDLYMDEFQLITKSNTVNFDNNSTVVTRLSTNKSFVWNKEPLLPNHIWFFYIKEVDSVGGSLSIAVTSVNPNDIDTEINELKDFRPTIKNAFRQFDNAYVRMMEGDELAVCIGDTGVFATSTNGAAYQKFGQLTNAEQYWIIADLTRGGVKSIQSVGIHRISRHPLPCLPDFDSTLNNNFETERPTTSGSKSKQKDIDEAARGPVENASEMASKSDTTSPPASICLKCKTNLPTILSMPCGHLVLCDSCCKTSANTFKSPSTTCYHSNCKKNITDVIRVYY